MLRETLPDETDTLCRLAAETAVFYDTEIETLRAVLDDYHDSARDYGHICRTWHEPGPVGFVYHAPVEMTDRTWEVWWIVVDAKLQGRGIGRKIMHEVERDLTARGQRLLLIETSSLPRYEPTRQFYLRLGYAEAARIPHFYRAGDDKVIFSKLLTNDRTS